MAAEKKTSPNVESRLRHNILKMPQEVYAASGIVINGRRLKSFVFTTDLAIIRNCDADAVFAVYPFTPQQAISDAIIKASYIPVFCGRRHHPRRAHPEPCPRRGEPGCHGRGAQFPHL